MSADQSAAESGVEYPGMGSAGFAFLAWYFHMVVCRWFAGGLGLWILVIFAKMWLMGWAIDCGKQKDPPKENKNPYSVKKTGGDAH